LYVPIGGVSNLPQDIPFSALGSRMISRRTMIGVEKLDELDLNLMPFLALLR
jgi:hypothetical protein